MLGPFVPVLVGATTLILILAANTAFNGFPLLAAIQAGDGFLPRQLTFRGTRLVYSTGIIVLAIAAGALIIVFNARTTALIPLYAIGVFMSFSLSQWGMVVHWRRSSKLKRGEERPSVYGHLKHDANWRSKQLINGLGGVISVLVMLIFAVTKFTSGAWITVILIPAMVFLFLRVHRHYKHVARILSLGKRKVRPTPHPMKTIVLVDDVHFGTVRVVEFAKSLGVTDGDLSKMRADVKANLEREVKRRAETRVKDQVMKSLLDATKVEVPRALLDMEIERLMLNMRRDLEQRGLKADQIPMPKEAFEPEAVRRVSLGLILAEMVRLHKLEAKPDQIKAVIQEYAQSYEKPEEVMRWYYQQPERLREVESIVLEDNIVQWTLSNAKVEDKPTAFDELMGNAQ